MRDLYEVRGINLEMTLDEMKKNDKHQSLDSISKLVTAFGKTSKEWPDVKISGHSGMKALKKGKVFTEDRARSLELVMGWKQGSLDEPRFYTVFIQASCHIHSKVNDEDEHKNDINKMIDEIHETTSKHQKFKCSPILRGYLIIGQDDALFECNVWKIIDIDIILRIINRHPLVIKTQTIITIQERFLTPIKTSGDSS
ncbi:MAG: hypothetical protein ACI8WB_003428 [Phenylobacterium sp.]|jgi:hypothetical protein